MGRGGSGAVTRATSLTVEIPSTMNVVMVVVIEVSVTVDTGVVVASSVIVLPLS